MTLDFRDATTSDLREAARRVVETARAHAAHVDMTSVSPDDVVDVRFVSGRDRKPAGR